MLISRRRRRMSAESASAVYLAFTTQPGASGTSPYTLSPQPVVAAKKSKGTTDTAKAGTVTISLVALSGSPVLSGTTTKALSSGVADFSANGLTVTGAGTWYLTASLSGLTGATSVTGTTTGNVAPNQPTISAGTPTSSGVTLTGSAFSDSDVGDTHAASQWQVTTAADTNYLSPVISTGDDATNKTSYAASGLTASTSYIARVRYKDSAGNYSSYSSNASFTTAAASGVALVNHAKSAGASTFTTTGIDTTGANFIVLALSYLNTAAPSISDNKGNTYTALTAKDDATSAKSRLYYCASPTVGTGHTVTVTGTSIFASVAVAAFSGVLGAAPLQVEAAGGSGTGLSRQPGSVTPAADGSLVVTGLAFEVSQTVTIDSGFAITDQNNFAGGTDFGSALAYLIQGTAAAVNPTWTLPSGNASAATGAVFSHG